MNGVIITNKRNPLSERDSQSILDLFKNFIGSLSDDATLYVTDKSCSMQYIIIGDEIHSYCIQWFGANYKDQYVTICCKHTTYRNGVKVTKEKDVCLLYKHVSELFSYAREIDGIRTVLY